MEKKRNSGKKNNGLFIVGLLLILIILIIVVFLVNKDQILTNLKETDFFGRIFGATPEVIEKHEIKPKEDKIKLSEDLVINLNDDKSKTEEQQPLNQLKEENINDIVDKADKNGGDLKSGDKVEKNPTTNVELCFILINNDGIGVRKTVKRTIPKGDSPLTAAINLLLEGPDNSKKGEEDLMTLIPEGSKLLSAKVSDGIAYLNFNEDFEFTKWGVEGAIHQLEQVVYTATAFSTVDKVQFLIEGKRNEFLGSEGQRIGSPLSRADF